MTAAQYEEVLEKLRALADPESLAGMAGYGIRTGRSWGVTLPKMRSLAREIGVSHRLAERLWDAGIRETRLLATMVDDPKVLTEEQAERWVKDLDSWDVCDGCCMFLARAELAPRKCVEWSARDEEFVKRAGFVVVARLAVGDETAGDELFEGFLPIIKRESTDQRNYVRKGVNWALRQIGKRNPALNRKAIETAREIQRMDSRSARWIASDALRELTGQAVQERLLAKSLTSKLRAGPDHRR
ncbi:MAG: DNA alkylation repair protein [Dehalococcoidia bacterium]|nr:DNA alkylation repair protein [Dehalococcoidia bacterium]MDP6228352.1 DNA alkylation repair protein [Dehalococcoidia bacterium]MDP7082917.1 DNA alkylation repair protein [Dehalococcoidia bacterium]HJN85838.1 DNA alkylation repair protein [Dehalococcoidia bacterium]